MACFQFTAPQKMAHTCHMSNDGGGGGSEPVQHLSNKIMFFRCHKAVLNGNMQEFTGDPDVPESVFVSLTLAPLKLVFVAGVNDAGASVDDSPHVDGT